MKIAAVFVVCLLTAAAPLSADVLAEALLVLPAASPSFEYDNLAELRGLPSYAALHRRFAGPAWRDVRSAFSKVGIAEEEVQQIAASTGAADFYGIAAGTFSGNVARKTAARAGISSTNLETEQILCPNATVCLLFLEDSVVAFGSQARLKEMLETRRGGLPRLSGNVPLIALLKMADRSLPIFGIGSGHDLTSWLGGTKLPVDIGLFLYTVKFDDKAHVKLIMECPSEWEALALRQELTVLSLAQFVVPFENIMVGYSGNFVTLDMDTSIQWPE